MKEFSLFIVLVMALSLISQPGYADEDTNPAYAVMGPATAIAPGMAINSTKTTTEYAQDTASAIEEMDVPQVFKPMMMAVAVPLSMPFGFLTGAIDGSVNAIKHGFHEPFSKESFSADESGEGYIEQQLN